MSHPFLSRLFPTDPSYEGIVDVESIKALQNRSLVQAGLGVMGAGARGAPLGQAIAEGVGPAVAEFPRSLQQAAESAMRMKSFKDVRDVRANRRAIMEANPRQPNEDLVGWLERLYPHFLRAGDDEAVTRLTSLLASRDNQAGRVSQIDRERRMIMQNTVSRFAQDTRALRLASEGYSVIRAASEGKSMASPIALMYAYARLLDPDSVVREGEIATLQRMGSVLTWLRGALEKAARGQMDPEIRRSIIDQANLVARQRLADFDLYRENALGAAEAQGIERDTMGRVLPDYYQRTRAHLRSLEQEQEDDPALTVPPWERP